MLYHIVCPEKFKACREAVKYAYWPEKKYLASELKSQLPASWPSEENDDKKIEKLEKLISGTEDDKNTLVKAVSNQPLYKMFKEDDQSDPMFVFPFLGRFHRMYIKRKWTQPYNHPQSQIKELFRLKQKDDGSGNYSANVGNFNHFVNVVSALARLIIYFKDVAHMYEAFGDEAEYSHLVFEEQPSMRTFKLMLAGFFHDIGKTVADPRHAVEGAIILGYHTTSARYQLHQIVQAYSDEYGFEREDLHYVAALVLYHDHFGTLGTGEDGYMALVNLIDHIKRYSLKHASEEPREMERLKRQMEWARRYLFDLWLLNIADILVSVKGKWQLQDEWENADEARARIQEFIRDENGTNRIHDLKAAFDFLNLLSEKTHSDDLIALEVKAHACSKRHVIERLRRLMKSALSAPLADILNKNSSSQLKSEAELNREAIAQQLRNFRKEDWNPIIVRAIQSVSNQDDFITRLSWIGKMDYSLGFFQELARGALDKILQELQDSKIRTGWLRTSDEGIPDNDYFYKAQAEFFADNFVATVIGILAYVLFREPSIDRLRNIEFSDAKGRLTSHKIEQLLALEGPFRTHHATEAIMQTIYFY
jgi:hypothetical protein